MLRGRKRLVFVFLLSVFLFGSVLVSAQPDIGILGEEDQKIINATEQTREFIEEEKWKFLGEQWKEFFLKNKFIAGLDSFFTKINWLFVVLFAKNYSFSIEMLFVFLLWLFTFVGLVGYLGWLKEKWQQWGLALVSTIVLAQIQIFNLLSNMAYKIVFLKSSFGWRIVTQVLIFVVLIGYLYLNKLIGNKLKILREAKEKKAVEFASKKLKKVVEGVEKGVQGD